MPVEIKELSIKIKVDETQGGDAGDNNAGGGAAGEPDEALIAAIVERVLEVLKEKAER